MNATGFGMLRHYVDTRPDELSSGVKRAMDAGGVVWRDAPDSEQWYNLDFLGRGKARTAWPDYWPQGHCRLAWDAIGRVQIGKVGWEWLLVSAFAREAELRCDGPPVAEGDERVLAAIAHTESRYSAAPGSNWVGTDFALATRLAVLDFLRTHGVCVRMLRVYFYADRGLELPSVFDWESAIAATTLALTPSSALDRRTYSLFLPFCA